MSHESEKVILNISNLLKLKTCFTYPSLKNSFLFFVTVVEQAHRQTADRRRVFAYQSGFRELLQLLD